MSLHVDVLRALAPANHTFGASGETLDYSSLHSLLLSVHRQNIHKNDNEDENQEPGVEYTIYVKSLTGKTLPVAVSSKDKVKALKEKIQHTEAIPPDQQRLYFGGRELFDDHTLEESSVQRDQMIFLILGPSRGGNRLYKIDPLTFSKTFDYDFSNRRDDGKTYMRGNFVYKRPYGWHRLAMQVLGKFENNDWLGPDGIRTKTREGEWPVSYHGTGTFNGKTIAEESFEIANNIDNTAQQNGQQATTLLAARGQNGCIYGVCTTPDINIAERYAMQTTSPDGQRILIVLQNRVNPKTVRKVIQLAPVEVPEDFEYWINPSVDDVRPYGICVKFLDRAPSWCVIC